MPFVMPHIVGFQRNWKHSLKYFQYFLSWFGILYHFGKLFFMLGAFITVLNHKEPENLLKPEGVQQKHLSQHFPCWKWLSFHQIFECRCWFRNRNWILPVVGILVLTTIVWKKWGEVNEIVQSNVLKEGGKMPEKHLRIYTLGTHGLRLLPCDGCSQTSHSWFSSQSQPWCYLLFWSFFSCFLEWNLKQLLPDESPKRRWRM